MILDPLRSIAEFPFYRNVPERSFPRCLGYTFYLGFLFSLLIAALIHVRVRPIVTEASEWLATSMPTITLSDGKATSSANAPVVIRPPQEEHLGILIDTNRNQPLTYEEMASRQLAIAVTQDSLFLALPDRKNLERHSFAELKTTRFVLDAPFYRSAVHVVLDSLYLFCIPSLWVFFPLWKLASALIYSLMALFINEATSAGLRFNALYRLTLYAQTPWIFLQAVMLTLHRPLPAGFHFLMGFAVTGAYLWKAIGQCRQALPPPAPAA